MTNNWKDQNNLNTQNWPGSLHTIIGKSQIICLFDLILDISVNNFLGISGWVFLG